ncbi:MAG: hypothetical protein K2Y21_06825 [Phycisphaerales bacterium]|nr:hypothetical protein [Phycisphaerales bacterium]
MKKACVAALCGGMSLCIGAVAKPAAFRFQRVSGSVTLYGDRVGPDLGAFENFPSGSGMTINVSGSEVGGRDATFTGIRQFVTGTYGPYAIVGGWRRSILRETAIRLQDMQGTALLTIYFDAGTMDWIDSGNSQVGWVMNLYLDQTKPSRVEPGPLLDGVVPPGTMPSVTFTMRGERFGPPSSDAGVIEFFRGEARLSGVANFTYACRADINNDNIVDDADFTGFVEEYAKMKCDRSDVCRGDFNEDGFVDDSDFAAFALAYDRLVCD